MGPADYPIAGSTNISLGGAPEEGIDRLKVWWMQGFI